MTLATTSESLFAAGTNGGVRGKAKFQEELLHAQE